MKVKSEREVAQSCLTLSDPMDHSLPGSSVHGIFWARVLEWGAILFSNWTRISCITGRFFTVWASREAQEVLLNESSGDSEALHLNTRLGLKKWKIVECMCWRQKIRVSGYTGHDCSGDYRVSVSCLPVSIFICVFSTDVRYNCVFPRWYRKTAVLNSNSCEDVSS